jgi:hypothetical protein
MSYQVFVAGVSNPIFTYKTWRGLEKRLIKLVKESALAGVTVEQKLGGETIRTEVQIFREPYGCGWQTKVGEAIWEDGWFGHSGFSSSERGYRR